MVVLSILKILLFVYYLWCHGDRTVGLMENMRKDGECDYESESIGSFGNVLSINLNS